MKECGKSVMRRLSDSNFLNRYFVGTGIDIGGAPDPLGIYRELFPRMGKVTVWDLDNGDAQFMEGVPDETYDFVHSSHCLEHMRDPAEALANWFRILKAGGHLVVTVPDEDLYEQGRFPSTFNRDHKATFTLFKERSWSPRSVSVMTLVAGLGAAADVKKLEQITTGYRYGLPRVDQTLTPTGECAIEFVVRKRTREELEFGGRPPRPGRLGARQFWLLTGMRPKG